MAVHDFAADIELAALERGRKVAGVSLVATGINGGCGPRSDTCRATARSGLPAVDEWRRSQTHYESQERRQHVSLVAGWKSIRGRQSHWAIRQSQRQSDRRQPRSQRRAPLQKLVVQI